MQDGLDFANTLKVIRNIQQKDMMADHGLPSHRPGLCCNIKQSFKAALEIVMAAAT